MKEKKQFELDLLVSYAAASLMLQSFDVEGSQLYVQ